MVFFFCNFLDNQIPIFFCLQDFVGLYSRNQTLHNWARSWKFICEDFSCLIGPVWLSLFLIFRFDLMLLQAKSQNQKHQFRCFSFWEKTSEAILYLVFIKKNTHGTKKIQVDATCLVQIILSVLFLRFSEDCHRLKYALNKQKKTEIPTNSFSPIKILKTAIATCRGQEE